MKTRQRTLLSAFLFCILALNAQVLTLEGTVVDAKTNKGIPYVNIGFPAASVGTSSNEMGGYILKIPKERRTDTLVFSSIGYVSFRVAVKDMSPNSAKNVTLQPNDTRLSEFVVKSLDANKIIKSVLKQRAKNYNTKPVLMQTFCREVLKEKDTEQYFIQSEGIVEVYKSSVKKNDDHVRLLKGRKKDLPTWFIKDQKQYPLAEITNGPTTAVIMDVVKSPTFFLMNINQFKVYHIGFESIDDRMVYVINFAPIDSTKRILLPTDMDFTQGKMYIDTTTKALVRADFELSRRGLGMMNILYSTGQLAVALNKRHYVVNYAEYRGKMYFKSANVENTYTYKDDLIVLTSKLECLVTKIDTGNVKPIPQKEEITAAQSLGENIKTFDDSFWADFNFIKSAETAIDTLPQGQSNNEATVEKQAEKQAEKQVEKQVEKKVQRIMSLEKATPSETVFFKGSFAEAQKLATAKGKSIFIDVYTDWCKPCKMMDAEAFHNPEVADLMNAFFINFKADAEKGGRDVASKYGVQAYPTVLVVNSAGGLIVKQSGYGGVFPFKQQIEGTISLLPYGQVYLKLKDNFDKKKRDFNTLLGYAQLRKKLGLPNEIITDAMVKDLPIDTLMNPSYQQLLYQFSYALEGKTFDFFLKHKDLMIIGAKLKTLITQNFNYAVRDKDKNLLAKVLKANTRVIDTPSVSEERNALLTLTFHEKNSKDKAYHESATTIMTDYYLPRLDSAKNQNNDLALRDYQSKIEQIGEHYAEHIKDKKYLEQMAALISKACEKHECSAVVSAYSQMLYRLKNVDKAKELMRKAVALSGNAKELVAILEKMEKGVF